MKIAIFISSLQYGGAEKQAIIDSNLLAEEHEVHLLSFIKGPQISFLNKNVHYHSIHKNNYVNTARKVATLLKKEAIDIIQCSLFAPMIITALSSFFHSTKIIWTFHSHEYDLPLKSKLSLFLLSRLPSIKKILFVNLELEDYFMKKYKFPSRKSGIVYNSSTFEKDEKIVPREINVLNIGYVGRLIELKQVEYLVELAHFLKSNLSMKFMVHIVGDGDQKKKLEHQVAELNLESVITFHGFQSDIEKFYNTFDLFINPSREECLSIALIDAGSKGIPCIAFNVGGNNEIILHKKTGLILSNKNELFEQTKILMKDTNLITQMRIEAKKHCISKFSTENHKTALNKVITNI